MILELLWNLIYWSFIVFVIGIPICVAVAALFIKIKRILTDWFGHELKNSDVNVRKAYIMKSDDEKMLKQVALDEYIQDIGVEAVSRINSKSALEEISQSDRFRVSRAAKRKIKEL